MISSKITLFLVAILGLFFQVSMAQSATTFTTSAVAEAPTGAASDLDYIEWFDEGLDDGDFDDGEFHIEDEDYETDPEDDDVVLEGKKPGNKGGKGKKPKGYKGVKGRCNSNRICDVHDPPHNCKCTHPGLTCTCKVPYF
ncbi:predicted protein [Aspergillus terreus NIH2624]|uniref:EGF-like domain-containing protein n=1 Tax=Aspergillus terreus (strain NIH 2624 / FGSC A1156) TaxID=341663 RepID=Q0CX58_ASPTN|nr:uncharacterized protein ATEG_01726 [Aspergillus terreus NIH2624]EAU38483.1 predicted protein [Aspergillus terreus NIH2624]